LAAAGGTVPTAAAQTSRGPEEQRPSRRVYTQPLPPEARAVQPEEVARAYRDALSELAAGSPAAAVAAVKALEPTAAPETSESARATLRGVAAVLDGIALLDPEALVPAILLHVELFRRHRDARDPVLADYHLTLIEHAAVLYAERGGRPAARSAAAQVLAAVGLALLEDVRRTAANRMLARALAFDPANADALLGLAVDRERAGAYPDAVDLLRRLGAVRPESAQARLRLAVNLQRVGHRRDARKLLTAVTAEPEAGWEAAIAYQELAKDRIAEADPAGAAALLREAIERFPASERLRLQLAYALDRAGDPAAAREAVAALAKSPPDGARESPRRLYNRSPESAPALDLDALRQIADERLGGLAAALDRLAAAETAGAPETGEVPQ
jgi:Tfp pilus assembly protein PilF